MATYRNLKELGDNILKNYDIVYLKEEEYIVSVTCLNSKDNRDNDGIFNKLGLNKYEFCSKYYGYEVKVGSWPVFNVDDYKAATRVVKALFEIIEEQSNTQVIYTPKIGELVHVKSFEECKRLGINTMYIHPKYYNNNYIVKNTEGTNYIELDCNDKFLVFDPKAIEPIQCGRLLVDSLFTSTIEPYTTEDKPNKFDKQIKCSSEFKFTVNKPKKVFF